MQRPSTSSYNLFDYKRSRSNSPNSQPHVLDLSYLQDTNDCLAMLKETVERCNHLDVHTLLLNNNHIKQWPLSLVFFQSLDTLDLSCNKLSVVDESVCELVSLKHLILKENLLGDSNSLPKQLAKLTSLSVINLSGNQFATVPHQVLDMDSLKEIYLGSNQIVTLPKSYEKLHKLEVLYLGGNRIRCVPDELCTQLRNLTMLNLSNNQISYLPTRITKLNRLRCLSLHNNRLSTLPVELVKMSLAELSLRNNPLVRRFAKENNVYNVPTLLELCGRMIKTKKIDYKQAQMPANLVEYLNSAQSCLNPKCKGVYFTSKIEHIKFVDFWFVITYLV